MSSFESIRQKQIRRIIAGTLFTGGLVGAIALAMPRHEQTVTKPIETAPIVTIEQPVEIKIDQPMDSHVTVEPTASEVKVERPQVALPHEETETNFLDLAKEQIDLGNVREAYDSLRRHIYKNEPTAEVLLNIGRLGRQIGEHAVAEQALLDGAVLEPTNAEIQIELARVMVEVGEYEEARIHSRQAIRLAPDDALAWNVAGRVAMKQSEWARAEGSLRRALELDPMNAMAHNNIGLLYIYTSRASDAIDSLETSVELFGENVPYFVYNNLGLAHEMAGNYEEARDAFEEALAVNPTYARASVNVKRVLSTIAALEDKTSYQTASGITPDDADAPL